MSFKYVWFFADKKKYIIGILLIGSTLLWRFINYLVYVVWIAYRERSKALNTITEEYNSLCSARQDELQRYFWSQERCEGFQQLEERRKDIQSIDRDLQKLRLNYAYIKSCPNQQIIQIYKAEQEYMSSLLNNNKSSTHKSNDRFGRVPRYLTDTGHILPMILRQRLNNDINEKADLCQQQDSPQEKLCVSSTHKNNHQLVVKQKSLWSGDKKIILKKLTFSNSHGDIGNSRTSSWTSIINEDVTTSTTINNSLTDDTDYNSSINNNSRKNSSGSETQHNNDKNLFEDRVQSNMPYDDCKVLESKKLDYYRLSHRFHQLSKRKLRPIQTCIH